jgi:hypothetical protein
MMEQGIRRESLGNIKTPPEFLKDTAKNTKEDIVMKTDESENDQKS